MQRIALILLAVLPLLASAEIYQYKDAQGNMVYSDRPAPGAQQVNLPPIQTYKPTVSPASANAAAGAGAQAKIAPATIDTKAAAGSAYTAFSIIKPAEGESIRENAGTVVVESTIQPKLRDGDKIQLLLDDAPQGEAQPNLTFVLNNIDRGEHTVQLQVLDAQSKVVAQTQKVKFYLLRYHISASLPNQNLVAEANSNGNLALTPAQQQSLINALQMRLQPSNDTTTTVNLPKLPSSTTP